MICKSCGEDKKYYALNMCKKCYQTQYQILHRKHLSALENKRRYKKGGAPMHKNKLCPMFLGIHVAERVLSNVFNDVKRMSPINSGYDFICNRGKKIDVKSACNHNIEGRQMGWTFAIKKNKIADFFLCIAFDNRNDLTPLYLWLIPSEIINSKRGAGISESSLYKWDEYKLDISKVVACCDAIR